MYSENLSIFKLMPNKVSNFLDPKSFLLRLIPNKVTFSLNVTKHFLLRFLTPDVRLNIFSIFWT